MSSQVGPISDNSSRVLAIPLFESRPEQYWEGWGDCVEGEGRGGCADAKSRIYKGITGRVWEDGSDAEGCGVAGGSGGKSLWGRGSRTLGGFGI